MSICSSTSQVRSPIRDTQQLQADRLFEKLLGRQFSECIMVLNLATAWQPIEIKKNSGYDPTLLRLVEKGKISLDSRQVVGGLSSDMSKAFDSVSSSLLIKKLESTIFQELPLTFCARISLIDKTVSSWVLWLVSGKIQQEAVLRVLRLIPSYRSHFKMILLI